jgi:uncharacterized protein YjiK
MKTNFLKATFLSIAITLLSAGLPILKNNATTGYDLIKPDATFVLPDILMEVSGVTLVDSSLFACIQDENGVIFIYDPKKSAIVKQYAFNIDGDYEGITKVGKTIYILRSDGTLFEIQDYTSKNFKLVTYHTNIPADNNEGLCYDKDNNRLLIGCKSASGKGAQFKDKRAIYGFDLKTKKLSSTPVMEFDLNTIKQFANAKNIELETKAKKKDGTERQILRFRTSEICIHPITKKLYLLSAADHMLFIFNMNGGIEQIHPLDPQLFNKSEGIAFLENGNMVITNEGQYKKPTMLLFRYKK